MEASEPFVNSSNSSARPMQEKQWARMVREDEDRSAFEKIFRAYYKRLHGFARTYVESYQEAEDIVQSVFLRIWIHREDWDPPGTVKSYLFTAVRNEALNALRHRRVVEDTEEEVTRIFRELKERSRWDTDIETAELRHEIQQGIEQLPPRCRQIFELNRKSGLTYSEIAGFLDISVNTVGTQMGRALQSLRDHLSDYLCVLLAVKLSMLFF